MESAYQAIQNCLSSRDQDWLNGLHHCKESLRIMTHEHINIRATLESVGKRQCELTKGNAKILDLAMKTVSGKKKVSLPQINISDYIPYIIVPLDVQNVNIPFSQPLETKPIPFVPLR